MDQPNPFRKPSQIAEVDEAWLMSYADMITLLMAFFVVFVSTSEPKQDELAAATRGMQARFGSVDLSTPFHGAFRAIQGIIDENAAEQALSVEKSERGLQIELSTSTYFVKGAAELRSTQMAVLRNTIDALKAGQFKDYQIIIEGHTDDVEPEEGDEYRTNWELAAARATRMVRLFLEHEFDPARLRAISFGSSRPKLDNLDGKGYPIEANRERNRRVVIKMERRW